VVEPAEPIDLTGKCGLRPRKFVDLPHQVLADQRALRRLAVADSLGLDAAATLPFKARLARRSAASRLSSACLVDTAANCAARRWAELGRSVVGCTDTVTRCLPAIAVSFCSISLISADHGVRGCACVSAVRIASQCRLEDNRELLYPALGYSLPTARLVVRVHQVGVAGVPRTVSICFGPWAIRTPVFRRRRASIADESRSDPRCESTRLANALPDYVLSATRSSSLLVPRSDPRNEEVRTAARSITSGRIQRPAGGNALRSTAPAPQSKPVAHASRLVAQDAPSVALGLGVRIVAAGPAHV
jgi:hypothetical protein